MDIDINLLHSNYRYGVDIFTQIVKGELIVNNDILTGAIIAHWEVVDLQNTYNDLEESRLDPNVYNKIISKLFIDYYAYSDFFDLRYEFELLPQNLQSFLMNHKPFLRFILTIFIQEHEPQDILDISYDFSKMERELQSFFKTQDAFINLVKRKFVQSDLHINSRNLMDLLSHKNLEMIFKVGNKNYLDQNNFVYNKALRVCRSMDSYTTRYDPWLSEYMFLTRNLDFASGALLISCLTISSKHLSILAEYLNQMPKKKSLVNAKLSLHSKIESQIKKCRIFLSRNDSLIARFEMYMQMKPRLRRIISTFINENTIFTRTVNIQNVILPMFPLALGIPGGSCMDDTIMDLMIDPSLSASLKGSHYYTTALHETIESGTETFAMITMGSLYRHLHEKTKATRGLQMIKKRICPFYTKVMNKLFPELTQRMKLESYILARCGIIEKMNNSKLTNYMNQIGDAL